ncbi:uncharacterized protein LOC105421934, partial [Amborella trichopoda]|uniref:uncharacterized protein LOC105421934 n=1 Tax=Amborella trichopoda TaxID=13333 RepID=UPI0005D45974
MGEAYDHVDWEIKEETQTKMGFGVKWRNWMRVCYSHPYFSILINGTPNDLLHGFSMGLGAPPVFHLQYADDTLVFSHASPTEIHNLFLFLRCFEFATGFIENYDKTTMMGINVDPSTLSSFADMWGCGKETLPSKYLGLPLCIGKPNKSPWSHIVDKVGCRLVGWKGRFLSPGGRLTLIKATLANISIYQMSIFHMPAAISKRIEQLMWRFLWLGADSDHKFHLIAWDKLCQPKKWGRL